MDFRPTEDQSTLLTALDGLAAQFEEKPIDFHGFALEGRELDKELQEAEFFDIAMFPELGPVAAALAVERLAQLPFTAETPLSMLVRPHLKGGGLPRPFAVVEEGRPGRFVAEAKTILVLSGDAVRIVHPSEGDVEKVSSIFAYPMGKLRDDVAVTPLSKDEADIVRKWIRVALAVEASGLIKAAIASTVEHLTVRKQFNRPLGSFQALQHRMSECAVYAGGLHWLALKAASSEEEGDAALAALYAQECSTRIVYDLHQMLGAMGMTLEHPLHLWTYRLKALLSELGGRGGQAQAVADACFS